MELENADSNDLYESVDILASDFLARYRDGDRPTVEEYVRRHPELGEPIRKMFPLIVSVERMKVDEQTSADGSATLAGHHIDRLDDYRIIREIGRGGMGIVFEAEQESLGRQVAVKVLPKQSLLDEASLARFQREAQTAAAMHHTNIVPIYGSGVSDGTHYLVMQLVRGQSLDTLLADDTMLPVDEVCKIGEQAADAIEYAHGVGVLHRDIKPANILIEDDGTAQITDFGLAKHLGDDPTKTQSLSGSLRYMSPERFSGVSDKLGDVYGLGVTLYELLTHRPAFAQTEPESLLTAITKQRVQSIRSIRPDVPVDVETIVMKAISPEPSQRYQSAGEVRDDFRRFLADEPIAARRISVLARVMRWCRRNKAIAAAIAITTSTLFAATVVSSLAYWQTRLANEAVLTALESSEATASLALESLDGIVEMVSVPSSTVGIELDETESLDVPLTVSANEMAILERVQPLYRKLSQQSPTRSDIVLQMMDAGVQLARIQHQLGNSSKAIETLERALETLQSAGGKAKVDEHNKQLRFARLNNELGVAHTAALDFKNSDLCYQAAVDAAKVLPEDNIAGQTELARAHLMLGDFSLPKRRNTTRLPGQSKERRGHVDESIRILERLRETGADHKTLRMLHAKGLLAKSRLVVSQRVGDELYQSALAVIRQQLDETPEDASVRFGLVQALSDVGVARNVPKPRLLSAEASLEQALAELAPLRNSYPETPLFAVSEVHLLHRLSAIARTTRRFDEAKKHLSAAIKTQTFLIVNSPGSLVHRCWRALLYRSQSELARAQGDSDAASNAIELAIADLEMIDVADRQHSFYQRAKGSVDSSLNELGR